ncbi:hypothetical protein [Streptomyces cyaneofuscatus]
MVSSSGPSILATGTPAPKNPWYWPCRPAGARPELICHAPADCRISPPT